MTNLLLPALILLSACSADKANNSTVNTIPLADSSKVLIVYLSRTNNTKAVAEMIHRKVGGKLTAIELQTPYPANYQATVQQVARENETGYLPPLKTIIDSIGKYEIIFIGFPTWGMQLPPPMKSFLSQYNLQNKTVIPFNTNGGYGIGNSFDKVKELCPNSTIPEGFTTRGGSERDGQLFVMEGTKLVSVEAELENWLKRIKVIE